MTMHPLADAPITKRYALLLRAYPRSWRRNGRTDEMLSVLLDSALAEGRVRPTLDEAVNLVAHGLLTRLRVSSYVLPYSTRTRIAQMALVFGLGLSLACFVRGEVSIPGLSDGDSPFALDLFLRPRWGPFLTMAVVIYIGWMLIAIAYFIGQTLWVRRLGGLVAAMTAVLPVAASHANHQRVPGGLLAALFVLASAVTLLPDDFVSHRRDRLGVGVWATLLGGAVTVWSWQLSYTNGYWSPQVMTSRTMFYWGADGHFHQINRVISNAGLPLIAAISLVSLISWRQDHSWLPATAFLLIPLYLLRLGTAEFSPPHAQRAALVFAATGVGIIVADGIILHALERRRRRRSRRPITRTVRLDDESTDREPIG